MPVIFTHCESVKDIRTNLKTLSHNPVVYRWWFPSIPEILIRGDIDFNRIEQRKINGEVYYTLYVGIGVDCQQRFSWHVSQHHTQSSVKHGVLSTLRQTLSAVYGIDMMKSENVVNTFMDSCYLEWNEYPELTKTNLESIESVLLNDGYYPLNIQKNQNIPYLWRRKLIRLRKIYKK